MCVPRIEFEKDLSVFRADTSYDRLSLRVRRVSDFVQTFVRPPSRRPTRHAFVFLMRSNVREF